MTRTPPLPALPWPPPPGRRHVLTGLACSAVGVSHKARADATIDPALVDIRRYVYIPGTATPDATIIDTETARIVGSLPTGVVARQAVVSRDTATLIATDGQSAAVSLVNVFTGVVRRVGLPMPARRLTVGTNGRLVAAIDPAGGAIAIVNLDSDRVGTVITGLPPLRDVMFGASDEVLYVAATGLAGVGVIDVAQGRLSHEIATFPPAGGGVASLARTPDGRNILAQPQGGGPISILDPEQRKPVAQLQAGIGSAGMFPSGTGSYLLVPDSTNATLTVFRSGRTDQPITLPGATGVIGAYSAWLDSIAFMPSAERNSVLVYNLDKMRLVDEIALHGTPVRGAVTPDSRTLYVPVLDPPQVVAVDGATQRVVARFDLPGPPLAALVAGGWGVCH